ncbi:hypothetical protein ACWD4O_48365 [Streptomyces sp. NPDC002623]
MSDPPRLRAQDLADFEAVLDLALAGPEIRAVLLDDATGVARERLRTGAFRAADTITAAAAAEYGAYLAARETAEHGPDHGADDDGSVAPALLVLTPLVSAASAVVVSALGHGLRLAAVPGPMPHSLVTAGWMLAVVAAVSTLVALVALMRTAVRQRGGTPSVEDRPERARLVWRRALLDRGMLPHLRRRVAEDASLRSTPPIHVSPPPQDRTGPSCSD